MTKPFLISHAPYNIGLANQPHPTHSKIFLRATQSGGSEDETTELNGPISDLPFQTATVMSVTLIIIPLFFFPLLLFSTFSFSSSS